MRRDLATWVATICVLAASFFWVTSVNAEERVALLIGNAAYQNQIAPLPSVVNDIKGMKATLEKLGFRVKTAENQTREGIWDQVGAFAKETETITDGIVLFYFSGHGMRYGQRNYLLPLGLAVDSPARVKSGGVQIEELIEEFNLNERVLKLVILDACRQDGFVKGLFKSPADAAYGIRDFKPQGGTIIAYASRSGMPAIAGPPEGRSLYTDALIEALETPGLPLMNVLGQAAKTVSARTRSLPVPQDPWMEGQPPADPTILNRTVAALPPKDDEPERDKPKEPGKDYGALCDKLAGHRYDPMGAAIGVSMDVLKKHADEAVSTCLKAIDQNGNEPRLLYQLSRAYYAQGQNENSLRALNMAVNKKYPMAYANLGDYYRTGEGVAQDYAKAMSLGQAAIEMKAPTGYFTVGMLYRDGKGVNGDPIKALEYFEKGAALGDAYSMEAAGRMIYNGQGAPRNLEKAMKYIERAAKQDHIDALVLLGYIHDTNSAFVEKPERAVEIYQKAVRLGSLDALNNLGQFYRRGRFVPRDIERAKAMLLEAANKGNKWALYNLAEIYRTGDGVKKDVAKAKEYYQHAFAAGSVCAPQRLSSIYYEEKNYELSIDWLKRGLRLGCSDAWQEAREWFSYNDFPEQLRRAAASAFMELAREGNATALRKAYSEVIGEDATLNKEIIALLEAQAEKGNGMALNALANLHSAKTRKHPGVDKNSAKSIDYFRRAVLAALTTDTAVDFDELNEVLVEQSVERTAWVNALLDDLAKLVKSADAVLVTYKASRTITTSRYGSIIDHLPLLNIDSKKLLAERSATDGAVALMVAFQQARTNPGKALELAEFAEKAGVQSSVERIKEVIEIYRLTATDAEQKTLSRPQELGSQLDEIGGKVFFDYGSSTLSDRSRERLGDLADWLKKNQDVRLMVEGHSDRHGSPDANTLMAAKRIGAVRDFLVGKGVAADRLKAVNFGKERLATSATDTASDAVNRRVEFRIADDR